MATGFLTTTVDRMLAWAQGESLAPLTFGLSCCAPAAEQAFTAASLELGGVNPRRANLLVVGGTVNQILAPRLRLAWEQMLSPRFVLAVGDCACTGGSYAEHGATVLAGLELVLPVDVAVPGCPPDPRALIEALGELRLRAGARR